MGESLRSRLLYTSPTANVYWSKEHGYHKCTRIGHSRILIPITFGFKSAFGAILKDFGRYASLVGERKQRGELARQNPLKSVPKAHKIKKYKGSKSVNDQSVCISDIRVP